MDRIDIHLQAPALKYDEMSGRGLTIEGSAQIRERVVKVRSIQKMRYQNNIQACNAYLPLKEIEKFCQLDADANNLLKAAVLNMGLTARAYHKILKVSRTIADLAQEEHIKAEHISEAIQYRSLDRMEIPQR